MSDLISRQAVDKIIDDLLENDNLQASPSVWHGLHMIKQLPSAQPEFNPVTAEDFAKTMSENSLYNFVAWHQEALTLMKEQGFIICKKMM